MLAVCTTKKVVQAGDSRQRDGPAFTQTRELAWNHQMMVESASVTCKACDCTLSPHCLLSSLTSVRETSRHLPGQARVEATSGCQTQPPSRIQAPPIYWAGTRNYKRRTNDRKTTDTDSRSPQDRQFRSRIQMPRAVLYPSRLLRRTAATPF